MVLVFICWSYEKARSYLIAFQHIN